MCSLCIPAENKQQSASAGHSEGTFAAVPDAHALKRRKKSRGRNHKSRPPPNPKTPAPLALTRPSVAALSRACQVPSESMHPALCGDGGESGRHRSSRADNDGEVGEEEDGDGSGEDGDDFITPVQARAELDEHEVAIREIIEQTMAEVTAAVEHTAKAIVSRMGLEVVICREALPGLQRLSDVVEKMAGNLRESGNLTGK